MKKVIAIALLVLIVFSATAVLAIEETNTLEESTVENALEVKEEMKTKKQEYTEKYGSDSYWLAGYILNEIVRPYSIPICFIGIVIGALYQAVLGTRRLDYKHRGFGLIISFVTILVICQVLPLIFTVVVIGWRG